MATSVHSSRSTTPRLPQIQHEFSSPGSDYMTYIYNVHAANRVSSPTVSSRSAKSHSTNGPKLPSLNGKENAIGAQFPDYYFAGNLDVQSKQSKKSVSELTSLTRQESDIGDFKDVDADIGLQLDMGNTYQRYNSPTVLTNPEQTLPVQSLQPPARSGKSSIRSAKTGQSSGSPFKLSFIDSPKLPVDDEPEAEVKTKSTWRPPLLSDDAYENMKQRLLSKGKFKNHLMRYFRLEKPDWMKQDEMDDDKKYDIKLDTQLGFELIADESAKEILMDGAHHDYMKSCRRLRRNPNSYFLRHCLDDELRMRYRYLSKGDSHSLCCQMKTISPTCIEWNISKHMTQYESDTTMSKIDLSDNGIQEKGMKHLSNILEENKLLTELILARNNMGPLGVKHLKHCLVSNCFLLILDISDNAVGEKGSKYIAAILEENTTLQHLNISRNEINDNGIITIGKALANNVSLKTLDVGWNSISSVGAVKLSEALKKNTELEVFRAQMNGFGEVGGKAIINMLRQNNVIKEVDLSANRITDAVIKTWSYSMDQLEGLSVFLLANNAISTKAVMDFLSRLMVTTAPICHIDFTGVHVTEDLKGLSNALHIVHDITIVHSDPPARREYTNDILTRNLVALCEFMEEEEIEVEDLYPDYEDWEDCDKIMITVKDALQALQYITVGIVHAGMGKSTDKFASLQCTGKVTQHDKLQRLKSKLRRGKTRKFLVKELALVYDNIICGKDCFKEKPLRSHLRHSIKEERAEKERKEKAKQNKRYGAPTGPSKS